MYRAVIALALSAVLAAASVLSRAERQFPADVAFAKMAQFDYPFVKIDKQVLRLAVGSRIYNDQNLIITPSMAPATADVVYCKDINGEVSQVWILSAEEARAIAANPPQAPAQ
ncbi:MAG: hypothetical protein ABI612_07750 [Betaproteobacteria bacterium]